MMTTIKPKITLKKHSHYYKDVSSFTVIDVYRVLDLYEVTDPCIAHAVKKLLCAGIRGEKDKEQDVSEAISALMRHQAMKQENVNVRKAS